MNNAGSTSALSQVFYYHRINRYSFNALAAALDADPELAGMQIHLARTPAELLRTAAGLADAHCRLFIAFSVMTPQLDESGQLIGELRARHGTSVTLLCGGPHATASPGDLLNAGADIAFHGEAEETYPELLKRIAQGREWADLPGIVFQRSGATVRNPRARPVDVDAYSSFSPRRYMLGPIEITRGCPFACSFCQTSHIFGARPRHRSVSNIVRQALMLRSRSGRVARLLSPNAFSYGSPDGRQLNLPALTELLSELRAALSEKGRIIFGYFPSEVRPEHVTPETMELLETYADNDEIVIGAQSGSKHMLEICRRSHSYDDVVRAVALARKAGYKVIVDFILGLPGECEEDRQDTVKALEELFKMGARIHAHAFVPLPQTAFAAERPGRISAGIVRKLEELRQKGAIYGNWVEQRRLARRIIAGGDSLERSGRA